MNFTELSEVAKKTNICGTTILDFLVIRKYLKKEVQPVLYEITSLGVEKGCKKDGCKLLISDELVNRISEAFNYNKNLSVKEQGKIMRKLREMEAKHD